VLGDGVGALISAFNNYTLFTYIFQAQFFHFTKGLKYLERHIISIYVENQAGVLSRISGLISRRGYNIDSLSVGETEDPRFSRITVVIQGDSYVVEQISKQVGKLFDVVNIKELKPEESIYRELALIKVKAESQRRAEIVAIVDIFRANIIDVSASTITIEMTGDQTKINAFCELMRPFGITEIARTGLTGLQRGKDNIKETEFIN